MPRPKGLPKTGGKQKGSKHKRTLELERRSREEGLMPLDYMLQVMRDPDQGPIMRGDMAKAAAPYLHARRAPEDKDGNSDLYTLIIQKAE